MRDANPDLAALISSVARQDRAAFDALYGRTAAKLLGIAIRILRDRAAAEDVVQDVYLRVWQGAASYTPESGRPMTWLITIARNRAIDTMRRRREAQMPQDASGRDAYESVADPHDGAAQLETADRLGLCLGRLDELHRRCMLDAYYEGFSREELAKRYDRPVNTIKTWLHRATQSLRTCLDET